MTHRQGVKLSFELLPIRQIGIYVSDKSGIVMNSGRLQILSWCPKSGETIASFSPTEGAVTTTQINL